MSKLYGQMFSNLSQSVSRRASDYIKTSCQSYDGSVITRLYYLDDNDKDSLRVSIDIAEGSNSCGYMIFTGSISELEYALKTYVENRDKELRLCEQDEKEYLENENQKQYYLVPLYKEVKQWSIANTITI